VAALISFRRVAAFTTSFWAASALLWKIDESQQDHDVAAGTPEPIKEWASWPLAFHHLSICHLSLVQIVVKELATLVKETDGINEVQQNLANLLPVPQLQVLE
jgi:hypothetical protein